MEDTTKVMAALHDVHKVYHMGSTPVYALAGVSVSFPRGEFCAIMGPSGSGKSTMLHILGCLDRPTQGHYVLAGEDSLALDDDSLSQLRLNYLGFIFQSFNLIPQLTVLENIELPLYYLGWDAHRSSQRSMELAELVGLGDRIHHRPSELSGGQQQRVAIARALSNDPAVLLADEPTGNLDTATGEQILSLLTNLNEQGKTILMVTHEPYIASCAHRQLHLRDGLIDREETA